MKFSLTLITAILFASPLFTQDLIPLSIGNSWTYSVVSNVKGDITNNDTLNIIITDTISINNKVWYSTNKGEFEFTGRCDETGFYEVNSLNLDSTGKVSEDHIFRIPGNGMELMYTVNLDSIYVSDSLYKITTTSGVFNCLKYRMTIPVGKDIFTDVYICSGTGMVNMKSVYKEEIKEYSLVSFELNNKK